MNQSDISKFSNPKCSGFGLGALLLNKLNPVGVEIGCSEGNTAWFLLNVHPTLNLTSIDPYISYVDWNLNKVDGPHFYNKVVEKMASFSDRFKLIKDYSDNVVQQFEDESLDFIFIDGLHTYDQVKKDCENYYSKIKPGGLFAGHDFSVIHDVNVAVKEFAHSVNKIIELTEVDVWYWYK